MKIGKLSISTHIAILVIVFLFVASFFLSSAILTYAHTTSTFYSKSWSSSPYYAFGELDSPLDTSEAKSSIHTGNDQWNTVAGASLDFNWSGNENGHVYWLGSACTTAPTNDVWIMTDDISPLGASNRCQSGSTITKATIRLDDTRDNWYVGSSTTVPSGKYDLRSLITHEFGHAGGFGSGSQDHFSGTTDCSGEGRQTMCAALPSATSYMRSLEDHDKHTFADWY